MRRILAGPWKPALLHYSAEVVVLTDSMRWEQDDHKGLGPFAKPNGLWVSCEEYPMDWKEWCESENFRLHQLANAHEVVLADDARVLWLQGANDLDEFSEEYSLGTWRDLLISQGVEKIGAGLFREHVIDWKRLASEYQGIVIAPYVWERRLMGKHGWETSWYYGWDCASGCIWDLTAIRDFRLREQRQPLLAKPEPATAED